MTTDRNKQIDQIARNCESLSERDRASLSRILDHGFHEQAACELFDEGIAEERLSGTCADPAGGSELRFIPSACRDLECFAAGDIRQRLDRAFQLIPTQLNTRSYVPIARENGRILRVGHYRIVFRFDDEPKRFVVLGITPWSCNPMLKVWRYLDQSKAEDLLRTSELYFRRVDRLEDEYEATPTLGRYLDERAVARRAFPAGSPPQITLAEAHKHCTYACCWRKDPQESWLAWKQYCPQRGGFAVQTTWRKLMHLHTRQRRDYDVHCRSVTYINHQRDDFSGEGLGEQAFYKALWFAEEREIRLVRFHGEQIGVDPRALKANPTLLCEGDRIRCDLSSFVEGIILNPFAIEAQNDFLAKFVADNRPELVRKVRPSAIRQLSVGSSSTK